MTREEIEKGIKCCNPYDENCIDCPFYDLPKKRCFEALAKAAFNMLLDDREKLTKENARLLEKSRLEQMDTATRLIDENHDLKVELAKAKQENAELWRQIKMERMAYKDLINDCRKCEYNPNAEVG